MCGGSSRILPPTVQTGPPFLASPLGPSTWAADSLWLLLRATATARPVPIQAARVGAYTLAFLLAKAEGGEGCHGGLGLAAGRACILASWGTDSELEPRG